VLIAGGAQDDVSAELFDPTDNTFTGTGSMTVGRTYHTATLLQDGRVLIAGGAGYVASAEVYDPVAGKFTGTGSMTELRQEHTATLLLDGRCSLPADTMAPTLSFSRAAELYDPTAGTFVGTGSMTAVRADHTATLLVNGKVLVAGGTADFFSNTVYRSAEVYGDTGAGGACPGTMCGSTCADLTTEMNNCGSCGATCSASSPATAVCTASRCLVTLASSQDIPSSIAVDATSAY